MTDSNEIALLPYSGSRLKEHQPNGMVTCYGADKTGSNQYRFNSLGFRGEKYNPNARYRVFVCGASSGFATGVSEEDSWWHHFKLSYAERVGVSADEVNLLNFSEGGTSCDYISRVLISQADRVRPDLIIISPSGMHGSEYFNEDLSVMANRGFNFARGVKRYAPKSPEESLRQPAGVDLPDSQWKVVLSAALGLLSFQTREVALVAYLKNMLLLQYYCQAKSIPYLIWSLKKDSLETTLSKRQWPSNILALLDTLERDKVVSIDVESLPRGADGRHPGAEANRSTSEALIQALDKLYTPAKLTREFSD